MGTFITEWEEGANKCREMFSSMSTAEATAFKLTEIAVAYKLDGWLINIENTLLINEVTRSDVDGSMKFKKSLVPYMQHFLRTLTEYMHKARPDSMVMWYDAVNTQGELKHQDTLTALNKPFFDCCDAIFINYTWEIEDPSNAVAILDDKSTEKRYDIYFGIDVFGRGATFATSQCSGYNVDKALQVLKRAGVSAAIFAPGWLLESEVNVSVDTESFFSQQQTKYIANLTTFWSSVKSSWDSEAMVAYTDPLSVSGYSVDDVDRNGDISIDFSHQPVGKKYYIDGIAFEHWKSNKDAYIDLHLQKIDMDTQTISQKSGGLRMDLCYDVVFTGSASLCITGIIHTRKSQSRFCLKSFGFEGDARRCIAQLDKSIGNSTTWLDIIYQSCTSEEQTKECKKNDSTCKTTFLVDSLRSSIQQGDNGGFLTLSEKPKANLTRLQQYGEMLRVQIVVSVLKNSCCDLGLVLNFAQDDDFEAKRREAWTKHRFTVDHNVRWKFERWQSAHSITLLGSNANSNRGINDNNKYDNKRVFYPSDVEYLVGSDSVRMPDHEKISTYVSELMKTTQMDDEEISLMVNENVKEGDTKVCSDTTWQVRTYLIPPGRLSAAGVIDRRLNSIELVCYGVGSYDQAKVPYRAYVGSVTLSKCPNIEVEQSLTLLKCRDQGIILKDIESSDNKCKIKMCGIPVLSHGTRTIQLSNAVSFKKNFNAIFTLNLKSSAWKWQCELQHLHDDTALMKKIQRTFTRQPYYILNTRQMVVPSSSLRVQCQPKCAYLFTIDSSNLPLDVNKYIDPSMTSSPTLPSVKIISLNRALDIDRGHLRLRQVLQLINTAGDDQYTGNMNVELQMQKIVETSCVCYCCMVIAFPRDGNTSAVFDFDANSVKLKNVKEVVLVQISENLK